MVRVTVKGWKRRSHAINEIKITENHRAFPSLHSLPDPLLFTIHSRAQVTPPAHHCCHCADLPAPVPIVQPKGVGIQRIFRMAGNDHTDLHRFCYHYAPYGAYSS